MRRDSHHGSSAQQASHKRRCTERHLASGLLSRPPTWASAAEWWTSNEAEKAAQYQLRHTIDTKHCVRFAKSYSIRRQRRQYDTSPPKGWISILFRNNADRVRIKGRTRFCSTTCPACLTDRHFSDCLRDCDVSPAVSSTLLQRLGAHSILVLRCLRAEDLSVCCRDLLVIGRGTSHTVRSGLRMHAGWDQEARWLLSRKCKPHA